jgi:hypothetical protein
MKIICSTVVVPARYASGTQKALVDLTCIVSDDERKRYLLEFIIKEEGKKRETAKTLGFIGKNPSTAGTTTKSDHTLTHLIRICQIEGYERGYVVNLSPVVATHSSSKEDCVYKSYSENLNIIEERLNRDPEENIFCFWGSEESKFPESAEIKKLIKNRKTFCKKLTKFGCPNHVIYTSYKDFTDY